MMGIDLDSIQQTQTTLTTSLSTKGSQKYRFSYIFSFSNNYFNPPYDPTPPAMTLPVKFIILDDNLHENNLPLPSTMSLE